MAIFDRFTKKKKPEPPKQSRKPQAPVKPKKAEKTSKAVPAKATMAPKKPLDTKSAWKVLSAPHITEKASNLGSENQYIFRIFQNANKIEVKKAIEDIYGVSVEGVKIINVRPKKRRLGRIEGQRKGYKKAIVKIKKGQEIEVLPR